MKNCTRCQRRLSLGNFYPKKGSRDGLTGECKACHAEKSASYRKAKASDIAIQRAVFRSNNREALAAATRKYQSERREETRVRNRAYYYADIERHQKRMALWHRANREELRPYYAEKSRRRFATRLKATPSWADPEEILAIYEKCRDISLETGIKHHVDHIVPLVHPLVCGLHVHWNLQILTAYDNLSKSNKFQG